MSSNKPQEVAMLDQSLLEAIDMMSRGLADAARRNRRTCVHCGHFSQQETCTRATPPMRPPARVIAFGCPAFEDKDLIPF